MLLGEVRVLLGTIDVFHRWLAGATGQSERDAPEVWEDGTFLKVLMELVEIIYVRVNGKWADNLYSHLNIDYLCFSHPPYMGRRRTKLHILLFGFSKYSCVSAIT